MISFKYKNSTKRIQMTRKTNQESLVAWLNQIFQIKGNILGFKTQSGKYLDVEYFCKQKQKFYGQLLQVMEASDQLEISFTSDNLSTSFVQPTRSPLLKSTNSELINANSQLSNLGYIHDIKNFEKVILVDGNSLSFIFIIEDLAYKANIISKLNALSNKYPDVIIFYHILSNKKDNKFNILPPLFLVYMGRKKVIELNLSNNFNELVQSIVIKARINFPIQQSLEKTIQKLNNQQDDDDCPSFLTNNILERISKQSAAQYINQMFTEYLITQKQLNKLIQLTNKNFYQFGKLFCLNLIDSDYQSFRNEVLNQLQKYRLQNNQLNLQDDEFDIKLQRPISRQQQRKSNLKKSVSNIQVVKVQNYIQILDTLNDLILQQDLIIINRAVIQENEEVFQYFADYLARKSDKQTLVNYLVIFASNSKDIQRPISRCIPRNNIKSNFSNKQENSKQEEKNYQKQQLKIQNKKQLQKRNEEVPQFGQSKKQNKLQADSFSPLKYLQNIDNSYKNAQRFLLKRINEFEPQQYGLLFHLLKGHDDSISNIIQELQIKQNDNSALAKLKAQLNSKIKQIFEAQFHQDDINNFKTQKIEKGTNIYMIFENFRYQANLNLFLSQLKKQTKYQYPKLLHKKSSMPEIKHAQTLSGKAITNRSRKFSDQQQSFESQSSNRRQQEYKMQILQSFYQTNYWQKQFNEMLNCVNFTDKSRDQFKKLYNQGCASVYTLIRFYINFQKNNERFDKKEMKKYIKKDEKPAECKRLLKYNIFKYTLRALADQKKLNTDKIRYFMYAFIEQNISIISAFENYFVSKDEKQFIQNLQLIFLMQQLKIQETQLQTFMNRLVFFLSKIYQHPNILTYTVKNHSIIFKSICQLYHLNADNNDFFQNLDLLNSYSFEIRFKHQLNESNLTYIQKQEIQRLWKDQQSDFVEQIIQIFEQNKDFNSFIQNYSRNKVNSHVSPHGIIPITQEQKKAYIKIKLQTIAKNTGNLDFLNLIKYIPQQNQKFNGIWDCYYLNLSEQDLMQNLEFFIRSLQDIQYNNIFQFQQFSSSPVLKKRARQKSEPLFKIIRSYSQSRQEDFKRQLKQFQQRQTPIIVEETLQKLGIQRSHIKTLLQDNLRQIREAVYQYLQKQDQQLLLFKIDLMIQQLNKKQKTEQADGIQQIKIDFAPSSKSHIKLMRILPTD